MSVVMLMLWKTLWCLLHLTPSCIGGINDVTEIQGTLKIHGRESYNPGPNRPTSFDLNFTAIRKDMLSSWQDNIPFDRTFYADNTIGNSVCGYFRGTQVDCFKNLDSTDCHLDAITYEHEVMIYLAYEVIGPAYLKFMNPANQTAFGPSQGRGLFQLYMIGTWPFPRNQSLHFNLRIERCFSDTSCSIEQVALLAYQVKYENGLCMNIE